MATDDKKVGDMTHNDTPDEINAVADALAARLHGKIVGELDPVAKKMLAIGRTSWWQIPAINALDDVRMRVETTSEGIHIRFECQGYLVLGEIFAKYGAFSRYLDHDGKPIT